MRPLGMHYIKLTGIMSVFLLLLVERELAVPDSTWPTVGVLLLLSLLFDVLVTGSLRLNLPTLPVLRPLRPRPPVRGVWVAPVWRGDSVSIYKTTYVAHKCTCMYDWDKMHSALHVTGKSKWAVAFKCLIRLHSLSRTKANSLHSRWHPAANLEYIKTLLHAVAYYCRIINQ